VVEAKETGSAGPKMLSGSSFSCTPCNAPGRLSPEKSIGGAAIPEREFVVIKLRERNFRGRVCFRLEEDRMGQRQVRQRELTRNARGRSLLSILDGQSNGVSQLTASSEVVSSEVDWRL